MLETQQLIYALAIPVGMVAVLGFLVGLIFKGNSAGVTLGLGAGLLQCYRVLHMGWPPTAVHSMEADVRGLWAVLILAVVLAVLSPVNIPPLIRWGVMLVAPAAAVWFTFAGLPATSLPPEYLWKFVGFAGGAGAVLIFLFEAICRKSGSASAALSLGPWCVGAAALLMLCGNSKFGWLVASVAVMLLGAFLAALVTKPAILGDGPVALVVTAVIPLLAYTLYDSSVLTLTELSLLIGAPVLGWAAQFGPIGRAKPWKRELTRFAIVLIPIGVAIGLAYLQFKKDSGSDL